MLKKKREAKTLPWECYPFFLLLFVAVKFVFQQITPLKVFFLVDAKKNG